MKLEFHGAAGGVTGSHMVLDIDGFRIGIDAGLFQGSEAERNRSGFGHDPRSLRALLLTHAHVDHSGRVPLLVKQGFKGPIYSTSATADLCGIMLNDSAHLMEEDADRQNRHQDQQRSPPRPPLYTQDDVFQAMRRFQVVDYNKRLEMGSYSVNFKDAGHILGSAMLELDINGRKLVFSGDHGRPDAPILRDPEKVDEADWLVIESTYGDKDHADIASRGKRLMEIVQETIERGGNVIIPAFAVGRTQEILFEFNPYAETGRLKGVMCFVDSPMAISSGEIYSRHPECFDQETLSMLKHGDSPLEFPGIKYARSRDESKTINNIGEPHIIISANGMCTGGRILHHLVHNLEHRENTILFVGYQAEGTLGQRLLSGEKGARVMDKELQVRARIESLDAFSAHAGQNEILEWLGAFRKFPAVVYLNHGEPAATQELGKKIKEKFETKVVIPKVGESYQLG